MELAAGIHNPPRATGGIREITSKWGVLDRLGGGGGGGKFWGSSVDNLEFGDGTLD